MLCGSSCQVKSEDFFSLVAITFFSLFVMLISHLEVGLFFLDRGVLIKWPDGTWPLRTVILSFVCRKLMAQSGGCNPHFSFDIN